MTREEPDYLALTCAVIYTICYLALPFYQAVYAPLSGWTLIQLNAVMVLPLLLGVLMILASLMLDIRISIGIGVSALLLNFILMLTSRSVLRNGSALTGMVNELFTNMTGYDLSRTLQITVGVGAVLILVLSTLYAVAELMVMNRKSTLVEIDDETEWK